MACDPVPQAHHAQRDADLRQSGVEDDVGGAHGQECREGTAVLDGREP